MRSFIAGFAWFTDWGRDTFIAMRGLCIERGRHDIAGSILFAWAAAVSNGMLPNRFPDHGATPEYGSVDASLWYAIAVHEFLRTARPTPHVRVALLKTTRAILDGYSAGTRYGIRMDGDGLVACGEPGTQLTWMDARVGDHAVTPRIGKPVEVQALWINALRCSWRTLRRDRRPRANSISRSVLERCCRLSLRRRRRRSRAGPCRRECPPQCRRPAASNRRR